jgi:predicted permease
MDWTAEIRGHLSQPGAMPDDDVVLELAQHATAAFEAARADGLDADAAGSHVRQLIAGWCADVGRLNRRPRRPAVVEPPAATSRGGIGFAQDVRYGIRLMRRQPGFALIATLLIALGVGAATTLFSLTYAVLLKPLPWPDPDRIVRLTETREGATRAFPNTITNATFLAWRDQPGTIDSLAAWGTSTATMTTTDGAPERLTFVRATASLFQVLGAHPLLGTLLTDADQPSGRDHVIVLSHALWQRRFGGRADIVGATLELNAEPYRIVGVMPREFVFPDHGTQAWAPRDVLPVVSATNPDARLVSVTGAIARLKPGATPEQASAEATARGGEAPSLDLTGMAMFGTRGKPRVVATRYLDAITAEVRPALYILGAAVALLFAAAVANIAGMQLARATGRRREVAIRAALGASAGRLARQLLAENLVLGLLGGLAGWLCSLALHRILPQFLPPDFPRAEEILAGWRVPVLAVGASLAASAIFGTVPAVVARRLNLVEALVEDSLAPVGGGMRSRLGRLRGLIMATQVAIAALLLVGASLLGRSFVAMLHVDRGYNPHNLVTAMVPMGVLKSSGLQRVQTIDAIVDRLEHTPGVVAAAGATVVPMLPSEYLSSFRMPSVTGKNNGAEASAAIRSVSPGYFTALGMRLVEGRVFTAADTLTSEPVIVVNRQFAHMYLADHAVGVTLPLDFSNDDSRQFRIVGVVDNVRQKTATDAAQPEIFNDYRQLITGLNVSAPVIVARTSDDPGALVPTMRAIVRDTSALLALEPVMTMEERLLTSLAQPRLYAVLLAVFAGAALLLCGVGLFGVLSYTVAQRTREIGIRTALGARPIDIAGLVARQGLAITGVGLAVGLGAAFLLVSLLGKLLYGVTAHDALSFVAVPAVIALVAALACFAPARRAARVDPLRALRRS